MCIYGDLQPCTQTKILINIDINRSIHSMRIYTYQNRYVQATGAVRSAISMHYQCVELYRSY